MNMSTIKQPAGGRYRERRERPTAAMSRRRDTMLSLWRQCVSRVLLCRCRPHGDGLTFDRLGIQAAQAEWLGSWGKAWRVRFRAAHCRLRYLHVANRRIVPRLPGAESTVSEWLNKRNPEIFY